LCQQIRNVTPSANIVFYMTWGRKNGDATNCANYPPLCTYQGMDSLLYWRYMQMAADNAAVISPVGRVWHAIRDSHPEIELYSSDESHPSVAGTYAAAVTFYTILFRKSPALITNNLTVDAATAQIIRETVQTVVFDSLDFWYQYAPNTAIAHADYGRNVTIYPNPCGEQITILTSQGNNAEIYDVFGKLVNKVSLSENSAIVNLSNCKSGIYFVRIIEDGRLVETVKIVKR
ncbi:MAG: T9SS type A sorting domain-containing protein, partial [Bacteroidales bacterium]|nr:T9SS type A sorting domain-containing protein [Bacteroidales bacterium]